VAGARRRRAFLGHCESGSDRAEQFISTHPPARRPGYLQNVPSKFAESAKLLAKSKVRQRLLAQDLDVSGQTALMNEREDSKIVTEEEIRV
jgi:hypothetical protein